MLGIERDDRFLPVFRIAVGGLMFSRLTFSVLRVDLKDFHLKQLLHRAANIRFRRQPTDLKCIGVATLSLVHSFFRDERAQNDLMRLKR